MKQKSNRAKQAGLLPPGRSRPKPTDAEIIAAARRYTDGSIEHRISGGSLPGHRETGDAWERRMLVRTLAPQLFADIANAVDLANHDTLPESTDTDAAEVFRRINLWNMAVHARRLEIQRASCDATDVVQSIRDRRHVMHLAVPSHRVVRKQGAVWRRLLESPDVIADMTAEMMKAHDVTTAREVWSVAVVLAAARCQVWELRAALHMAKQIRARKNARVRAKRAVSK